MSSIGGRSKIRQPSWRNGRTSGVLAGHSKVAQPIASIDRVRRNRNEGRATFVDEMPDLAGTFTASFAYNGTNGSDGSVQTLTVPAGLTTLRITGQGASGSGSSNTYGPGGLFVVTFDVDPDGETFDVYIGGSPAGLLAGGFNGGGVPEVADHGGGGATDIRTVGGGLSERLYVAAGGGGGGTINGDGGGGGGANGTIGEDGERPTGGDAGRGGTQTAGGAGNDGGFAGTFGVGGAPEAATNAGAGGGGWYGGGGAGDNGSGNCGGGGGGSSFIHVGRGLGLYADFVSAPLDAHGSLFVESIL